MNVDFLVLLIVPFIPVLLLALVLAVLSFAEGLFSDD